MQSLTRESKIHRPSALVFAALAVLSLALAHCNSGWSQELSTADTGGKNDGPWRGLHIMSPGRDGLPLLKRAIAEKLAPMGINTLIMEVNRRIDRRVRSRRFSCRHGRGLSGSATKLFPLQWQKPSGAAR